MAVAAASLASPPPTHPRLNMTNASVRIAKAQEILRAISAAGTPSDAARTRYPIARLKQTRLVKVNRSIDADSAMSAGKKASAERWRSVEAIVRWSVPRARRGVELRSAIDGSRSRPFADRSGAGAMLRAGKTCSPAQRRTIVSRSVLLERAADFGEHRADFGANR